MRWRLELWWFLQVSKEATVMRSCGHEDTVRLRKSGFAARVKLYRATMCPKCGFHAALDRMRPVETEWPLETK